MARNAASKWAWRPSPPSFVVAGGKLAAPAAAHFPPFRAPTKAPDYNTALSTKPHCGPSASTPGRTHN